MTCHCSTKSRSSGATPTNVVTYRHDNKLVYVPVAPDYIQALSHARDAFPQLKRLRDASLSLSLTAPGQEHKFVVISAEAWPILTAHMLRFQVIDVHITQTHEHNAPPIPEITITYADAEDAGESEPVPPYQRSDLVDDEKAPYSRPRTLSTSTLHTKRSWFFQKLYGH